MNGGDYCQTCPFSCGFTYEPNCFFDFSFFIFFFGFFLFGPFVPAHRLQVTTCSCCF